MLVLDVSKKHNIIHLIDKDTGEHIEIALLSISMDHVKLGFSASENIEVLRDKLYQRRLGNE